MPEGYYDLILMDIQMPIKDGYESTKIIWIFKNNNAQIPNFAFTANAFEEDRKHALQLGMNDHLAKPVDIEKLKDNTNGGRKCRRLVTKNFGNC